jgi:hypothetical protein
MGTIATLNIVFVPQPGMLLGPGVVGLRMIARARK